MNKNSIKSLVLGFIALFSAFAATAAGNGTSGNPYTVCATSPFQLTSSVNGDSYKWFTGNGTVIGSATTITLSVPAVNSTSITDTSFRVVVYNAQGCPSDTGVIYVKLIPPATVTATTDNANFCSNQASGSTLQLNSTVTTGGTLPGSVTATYAWSGPSPAVTPSPTINNGSTANATTTPPSTAGSYTYTLTVDYTGLDINTTTTNTNGCKATGTTPSVNVSTSPATPNATIAGS